MSGRGNRGNKKPCPLSVEKADETVTHGQLNDEFNRFRIELSESLTKSISQSVQKSVNASINNLQQALDSRMVILQESIDSTKHEFETYKALTDDVIKALNKRISELETTTLCQLIHDNDREQRHRSKSFRLHGKKSIAKDARSSVKEVYDFVVVPSLQKAVDNGELDEVPPLTTTAEFGHNLRPKKEGDIPSTIFKFSSRYLYHTFMQYARDVIKEINVRDNESYRVSMDLTYWNRKCMSKLFDEPLVGKVRMSGTTIQYQLKSDSAKWHPVKNPTANTLVEMKTEVMFPEIDVNLP